MALVTCTFMVALLCVIVVILAVSVTGRRSVAVHPDTNAGVVSGEMLPTKSAAGIFVTVCADMGGNITGFNCDTPAEAMPSCFTSRFPEGRTAVKMQLIEATDSLPEIHRTWIILDKEGSYMGVLDEKEAKEMFSRFLRGE